MNKDTTHNHSHKKMHSFHLPGKATVESDYLLKISSILLPEIIFNCLFNKIFEIEELGLDFVPL